MGGECGKIYIRRLECGSACQHLYKSLKKKDVGLVPIGNGAVRCPKAYNSLNKRADSSDFRQLLGCTASVSSLWRLRATETGRGEREAEK